MLSTENLQKYLYSSKLSFSAESTATVIMPIYGVPLALGTSVHLIGAYFVRKSYVLWEIKTLDFSKFCLPELQFK